MHHCSLTPVDQMTSWQKSEGAIAHIKFSAAGKLSENLVLGKNICPEMPNLGLKLHFGEIRVKIKILSTHNLLCRKFALSVIKMQLSVSPILLIHEAAGIHYHRYRPKKSKSEICRRFLAGVCVTGQWRSQKCEFGRRGFFPFSFFLTPLLLFLFFTSPFFRLEVHYMTPKIHLGHGGALASDRNRIWCIMALIDVIWWLQF